MELNSDISDFQLTPPEIRNEAQIATERLLPAKLKEKYLSVYDNFLQWKANKKASSFSENVLLAYFNEMAAKYKPSTLWSQYSMLKSTIKTKNNVDLARYVNLTAFLKRLSDGYKPKKARVLSADQVKRFLDEAPDHHYLATKVSRNKL